MDTNTIAAIVVAILGLVIISTFLIFRQRGSASIKGPFGTQLEVDASNEPTAQAGVTAKGIISREGGVKATDTTGKGVDVENIDAKKDVVLSSGNPQQQNNPRMSLPQSETPPVSSVNAQTLIAGGNITIQQQAGDRSATSGADLRLVDVAIEEPKDGFPVLDIKVRNAGTEVVFIKRAEFEILKTRAFRDPRNVAYSAYKVSWNYDVKFDIELEGKIVTKNLSQSLDPNSVDRFTFTIGQEDGSVDVPSWYYFRLTLVYNEDDKRVESKPILISVPSPIVSMAFTTMGGNFINEEAVNHNRDIVSGFAKFDGLRSPTVQGYINKVLGHE